MFGGKTDALARKQRDANETQSGGWNVLILVISR